MCRPRMPFNEMGEKRGVASLKQASFGWRNEREKAPSIDRENHPHKEELWDYSTATILWPPRRYFGPVVCPLPISWSSSSLSFDQRTHCPFSMCFVCGDWEWEPQRWKNLLSLLYFFVFGFGFFFPSWHIRPHFSLS